MESENSPIDASYLELENFSLPTTSSPKWKLYFFSGKLIDLLQHLTKQFSNIVMQSRYLLEVTNMVFYLLLLNSQK